MLHQLVLHTRQTVSPTMPLRLGAGMELISRLEH